MDKLYGKFHSHITVLANISEIKKARDLIGGKITRIILGKDDIQTDTMITHHYVSGKKGIRNHQDILNFLYEKEEILKNNGFEVLRVKLEHEIMDRHSPKDQIKNSLKKSLYLEVHIKLLIQKSKLPDIHQVSETLGWVGSRNPLRIEGGLLTQFVNRRFYNLSNLDDVQTEISAMSVILSQHSKVQEVKIETVLKDSNNELDLWWTKTNL